MPVRGPGPRAAAGAGADAGAGEGGAPRVLVIKLGALGDFVQALGPMQAIRAHHPGARITLLTTPPFAGLARASGCFDAVWTDGRPAWFDLGGLVRLAARLRAARFDRVYDLQTSDRSALYFHLMRRPFGGGPEWVGIARGCSHPHDNPARRTMHTIARQADQLARAGIARVPPADFSFLDAEVSRFALERSFALLVPGGAAHRPEKRWPAARFGALARRLADEGITPVVLGVTAERPLAQAVAAAAPGARDLTGETTLAEVAALARRAHAAVGNDTGPMHVIAGVGCPSVVLFSAASDPALCAPRGPAVTVVRRAPLDSLGVDEVAAALDWAPAARGSA